MDKVWKLLLVSLIIISCDKSKHEADTSPKPLEKTIQKEIVLEKPQSKSVQPLRYGDMPNQETKVEIIQTVDKEDNTQLFSTLITDLSEELFEIESTDLNGSMDYHDCNRNMTLKLEGKGVRKYYIKRQEDKPKNYYPDFTLWVYEFDNIGSAKRVEDLITSALLSGNRSCNGKDPGFITRNGNEVFQLSTRAEMFRGYINDFGERIENYH